MQKSDAMIAEIGQRFARRMIGPYVLGQRGIAPCQLARFPQAEIRMIRREHRHNEKNHRNKTNHSTHTPPLVFPITYS